MDTKKAVEPVKTLVVRSVRPDGAELERIVEYPALVTEYNRWQMAQMEVFAAINDNLYVLAQSVVAAKSTYAATRPKRTRKIQA